MSIDLGGNVTDFAPANVYCKGKPDTIHHVAAKAERGLPIIEFTPGEFAMVNVNRFVVGHDEYVHARVRRQRCPKALRRGRPEQHREAQSLNDADEFDRQKQPAKDDIGRRRRGDRVRDTPNEVTERKACVHDGQGAAKQRILPRQPGQ
ncbi:hypothetical protein [Bowdeniella nasicola]|uniref:hypothetical protein n=1 Tax=Bowdeniella nasicola TaxID=208480 RepID=UPI00115F9038|nr:hypothetical protein [Bowdeniella nasicola]